MVIEDSGEEDAPAAKRKRTAKAATRRGPDGGTGEIDTARAVKTVSLLREQVGRMHEVAVQLSITVSRMADILGDYRF